jgi:hypothetical protein
LSIQLDPGAANQWEVRLGNAVPDAQLTVSEADTAARMIAPVETDIPTERVWNIDGLTPEATVTLSIAPPNAPSPRRGISPFLPTSRSASATSRTSMSAWRLMTSSGSA